MTSLFADLGGYASQTIAFKSTKDGDIKLDVAYPELRVQDEYTVLLHYHGGFLVVGDRYSFFPHWLVRACASRKWIFVTPEYRLLPEVTAHSSLEDAADAYNWVLSSLPSILGINLGSVLLAGSSIGGYLALATAATVSKKPSALLSFYGMLDPTNSRYTTPGSNIFGRPVIDAGPILANYPMKSEDDTRPEVSAHPVANPAQDPRYAFVAALHIAALFPDYMTGISGLSRDISENGVDAIPLNHRNLFPLSFAQLSGLPQTMLVHGMSDSAVPAELTITAEKKLRAAGVAVEVEYPTGAEHGFDSRMGNIDVENDGGDGAAATSLRNVLKFLDGVVAKK